MGTIYFPFGRCWRWMRCNTSVRAVIGDRPFVDRTRSASLENIYCRLYLWGAKAR
jgi:hypothetical protein